MPKSSRPARPPSAMSWSGVAATLGENAQPFADYFRHSHAVLGRIPAWADVCADLHTSRRRHKRRSPTFHPDPLDQTRPRKRTSRTPFFIPPNFDDDIETAIHHAALNSGKKEILGPDSVETPAPHDPKLPEDPDKLVIKLRLPGPAKGSQKVIAKRQRSDRRAGNSPKRQHTPEALDVSRQTNPETKALRRIPKSLPESQVAPAAKIVHPLQAPKVSAPGDVLPVDVPQSPKTPLEHILHFARGSTSVLAKIEKNAKKDAIKKRATLATFNGCDELGSISLSAYLRSLASMHLDFLRTAVERSRITELLQRGLDDMQSDATDEQLAEFMSKDKRSSRRRLDNAAPFVGKTVDLIQLVLRLWQKMLCAEESIAQAFILRWYTHGVLTTVSELAWEILSLWYASALALEPGSLKRSELVEWCVRLLTAVLVFELSPMSAIFGHVESGLVFGYMSEKVEAWLPKLLDMVLHLVGCDEIVPARECRVAAGELCQLYVVRHHCPFPAGCHQEKTWEKMCDDRQDYLEVLISHKSFWSTAVNSAIQLVQKQEQTPDAIFGVAFLDSLLLQPVATKSLTQKQTFYRGALLGVLAKLLERVGRQLLSSFVEIERAKRDFPGLASSVDLIRKLMFSAVLQRELISGRELERKKKFLDAISNILSRLAKFVPGDVDDDKIIECARKGAFCGETDELQKQLPSDQGDVGLLPELSDGEAEDPQTMKDCAVARHRALAFGAWLIGSLGKSLEDGSRDMTQMNGLQILVSSRFNSARALKKLWGILLKIQIGLEQHVPGDSADGAEKPPPLLSDVERNHFSMSVEAVRVRVISDAKDRSSRGTPENTPKQSSSEGEARTKPKRNNIRVSFPDISRNKLLRSAVVAEAGYEDLDDDPHVLEIVEKTCKYRGEQALARYDPDSENVTQWYRLQRRNVYIDGARELLDKADKTEGQKCSCMPGIPTGRGSDHQTRIACSNNLCENRSTHVECDPDKCGAGSYCQNQRMQKMQYAKMKPVSFPGKGVGMVADEDIAAGAFIGEYQGEVISMKLFEKRKKEYQGERHFYFMTLTGKLVIDASRKSQATRFANHSCEPNAETQKWNAGGEPRVGIFALRDIAKSEEITFDYGARSLANDTVPCLCGTKTCRGFLTIRKKPAPEEDQDEVMFDTSGFVNTADDMKQLPALARSSDRESHGEDDNPTISKSDSDKLQESVQKKIRRGKKDIALAEEIAKRRDVLVSGLGKVEDSTLTESAKNRLSQWETCIRNASRKPGSLFSLSTSASKPESGVRIPRRPEIPRQGFSLENYLRKESEEKNSLTMGTSRKTGSQKTSVIPRKPPIHKASSGFKPSPPSRPESANGQPWRSGVQHNGYNARRPEGTRNRTLVEIQEAFEAKSAPQAAEPKPVRKRGPIRAFLPTAPKVKKPLPTPKFAEKPKPKRDDSDEDSMDNFSVASSAEPIIEEDPPLSPSNLPDGLGACSDDEFVAASPVDAAVSRPRNEEPLDSRSRNVNEREPIDVHSRQGYGMDRRRPPVTNRESFGESYRGNIDRSQACPERDGHAFVRNVIEKPGTRSDDTKMRSRDDARRPDLRPWHTRPDDGRGMSGDRPMSALELQEGPLPGPHFPRMPSAPIRRPEHHHEQYNRGPPNRPYHDDFNPPTPERMSYERTRPLTGPRRERLNDSVRMRDDRGGRLGGPDNRDGGHRHHERRELRRETERYAPDTQHDVHPPPREDGWRDGHVRDRRRESRGKELGHGAPERWEARRDSWGRGGRGEGWRGDVGSGIPPRRGDNWSGDIGHREAVRRQDHFSVRLSVEVTHGNTGRREMEWTSDRSPGRRSRGRDVRREEAVRGRHSGRDDDTNGDAGTALDPRRREVLADEAKFAIPAHRADVVRDEGNRRLRNAVNHEADVLNLEQDSGRGKDRDRFTRRQENKPSSRFANSDVNMPGSGDSHSKLPGTEEEPVLNKTVEEESSAQLNSRKEREPRDIDSDVQNPSQLLNDGCIEEPKMSASEKATHGRVGSGGESTEHLEMRVGESLTTGGKSDKDVSRDKSHSAKLPAKQLDDPVKKLEQGEAGRPLGPSSLPNPQKSGSARVTKTPPGADVTGPDGSSRDIGDADPGQEKQNQMSSNKSQKESLPNKEHDGTDDAGRVQSPDPLTPRSLKPCMRPLAEVAEQMENCQPGPVSSGMREAMGSGQTPDATEDQAITGAWSLDSVKDGKGQEGEEACIAVRGGPESPKQQEGNPRKGDAGPERVWRKENRQRLMDDGVKSQERGSQGKFRKSSSLRAYERSRMDDAARPQDANADREKSVMQRIGRRPGDGLDRGGRGHAGTGPLKRSRSGGNFGQRHQNVRHEHRRRLEGPNEYDRKRYRDREDRAMSPSKRHREDEVRSQQREGPHGVHGHRRKHGDIASHRHSGGRSSRSHPSSEVMKMDQSRRQRTNGNSAKQTTSFLKSASGSNPSKSNSDLRSLLTKKGGN